MLPMSRGLAPTANQCRPFGAEDTVVCARDYTSATFFSANCFACAADVSIDKSSFTLHLPLSLAVNSQWGTTAQL